MTNILKELIQESHNPYEAMNSRAKGLVKKWERSGLLEDMPNDIDKTGMAVLLENQAQQLLLENSRTGGAGAEEWSGVALPLVRKVFAEISAKELISVQPLNLPSGLVFYMDFQYGTGVAPRLVGESLYGQTSSSTAPTGGLYGAGRFGYSSNDFTASITSQTSMTSSAAATSSVNFELSPTGLSEITVSLSDLTTPDRTAVRTFVPSGSGWTQYFPAYTRLSPNEDSVIFVVNASAAAGRTVTQVTYSKQPTASARGDFEDTVGSSIPPTGANLNIPEINLNLRSESIVAKTRKLKAVWTPELAQDLNAYHSIDAEQELTAMLSEYISLEIDLEILEMLLVSARTTGYWSKQIGTIWNGTAFASDTNLSAQAWTTMTWYQTLGNEIQRISNKIHQLTLRGGANWLVVSPEVASIIESIPGWTPKTDGNQSQFSMGVSQIGSFQNRFTVYKNPYLTGNVILLGFRGSNFLETGAVYAPYIPMIMTPLVYDPENFTPRRGVLTRYAKKMVRSEFFAKIFVHGL